MDINELIEKLTAIRDKHGNVPVEIDLDDPEEDFRVVNSVNENYYYKDTLLASILIKIGGSIGG